MAAKPKINSDMQFKIERIIWLWEGKLTWDSLVKKIQIDLSLDISRQTLQDYVGIYTAYKRKKDQPSDNSKEYRQISKKDDNEATEKIAKLKIEIKLQAKIINEQKRFLQRILQNASEIPALKGNLDILIAERPEDKM